MRRLHVALAAALLLFAAHVATSQRNFDKVEFETTHVAGNVHMLNSGVAGNVGISIGSDGVLMIDDQFAPLAPKIRAAIASIGEGRMRFVINTHHHGDHTGGNEIFGSDATVVAHQNVRRRLAADNRPKAALPVVTFDESLTLHFNDEEIEITHLPTGHTDGDIAIYFKESNVVHMGDQFFAGRFPYIDVKAGGNAEGYLKNVTSMIGRLPSDVKIIPGHGPLSALDDLKTFGGMLEETIGHVRSQMEAGMSLAEIQQAGLPAKWEPWGTGFINPDRWIEIVYSSLDG